MCPHKDEISRTYCERCEGYGHLKNVNIIQLVSKFYRFNQYFLIDIEMP
jgi:hypothetical protein